jgi:hypothetical protein
MRMFPLLSVAHSGRDGTKLKMVPFRSLADTCRNTFSIPETFFDDSLFLNPRVFLLGILFPVVLLDACTGDSVIKAHLLVKHMLPVVRFGHGLEEA